MGPLFFGIKLSIFWVGANFPTSKKWPLKLHADWASILGSKATIKRSTSIKKNVSEIQHDVQDTRPFYQPFGTDHPCRLAALLPLQALLWEPGRIFFGQCAKCWQKQTLNYKPPKPIPPMFNMQQKIYIYMHTVWIYYYIIIYIGKRLEVPRNAIQVHSLQLCKMSLFTVFYGVLCSSHNLISYGIGSTCGQHTWDMLSSVLFYFVYGFNYIHFIVHS